jgi:hypothetical protein
MTDKIPFDAIRKKNLANIFAKVRDGKPLTATESRTLDNHQREQEGLRKIKTEDELAVEFLCKRMTISRAKKARRARFDVRRCGGLTHGLQEEPATAELVRRIRE